MTVSDSGGSIRRFFTGLTEHAFQIRLGVVDPPLVDYLSSVQMEIR